MHDDAAPFVFLLLFGLEVFLSHALLPCLTYCCVRCFSASFLLLCIFPQFTTSRLLIRRQTYAFRAVNPKLIHTVVRTSFRFSLTHSLRMARPRHPCTQDMATQVQMYKEKRDTLPDVDGEPVGQLQKSKYNIGGAVSWTQPMCGRGRLSAPSSLRR